MKVIIHLGLPKTGSTYLQNCLVSRSEELANNGVIYPISSKHVKAAAKKGQGVHNVKSWSWLVKTIKQYKKKKIHQDKTLLFSREKLFNFIVANADCLPELARLGVDVELIVFSRCPMAYLQSIYAQIVKSDGYNKTIEEFVQANNYRIDLVKNMVNLIDKADSLHIPINIYNYSNRKKNLLSLVETHLDVPQGTLKPEKENMVINRSLTPDEVLLVRAFNKFLGEKANKLIAKPLFTNLPELKAQKIKPEQKTLEKFITNMNTDIDGFNQKYGYRFDAYDRLNADEVEGVKSPECATLSPQQLEVVASAMANHLKMQQTPYTLKQTKLKRLKPKFSNKQMKLDNFNILRNL